MDPTIAQLALELVKLEINNPSRTGNDSAITLYEAYVKQVYDKHEEIKNIWNQSQ